MFLSYNNSIAMSNALHQGDRELSFYLYTRFDHFLSKSTVFFHFLLLVAVHRIRAFFSCGNSFN